MEVEGAYFLDSVQVCGGYYVVIIVVPSVVLVTQLFRQRLIRGMSLMSAVLVQFVAAHNKNETLEKTDL